MHKISWAEKQLYAMVCRPHSQSQTTITLTGKWRRPLDSANSCLLFHPTIYHHIGERLYSIPHLPAQEITSRFRAPAWLHRSMVETQGGETCSNLVNDKMDWHFMSKNELNYLKEILMLSSHSSAITQKRIIETKSWLHFI